MFEKIREKLDILSDEQIDYLLNLGMESENLDYKEDLNIDKTEDVVKIAKDIAAMANTGGGYIILGVDKNFNKKGLTLERKIDEAILRSKINKYFYPPIEIHYREVFRVVNGETKKFGVIHVSPSGDIVIARANGNYCKKNKTVAEFHEGEILIRDGSKSKPVGPYELRKLIDMQIIKRSAETLQRAEAIINFLRRRGEPDKVKEKLSSNLFKVEKLPEIIWYADTEYNDKRSVYDYYKEQGVEDVPPFILKEKKVFTFSNLSLDENILREIINVESVSIEKAYTWISEEIKRRYLMELLNVTIRDDHCKRAGLIFDGKQKRYYFPALPGGRPKKFSWMKNGRKFTRTVVKWDKKNSCYIHDAARIKFGFVGNFVFLVVDPCFLITYDGRTPATDERARDIYTKLSSEYYNNKYLNDLIFWISLLKGKRNRIVISGLDYQISISPRPLSCMVDVGIKEEDNIQVI